jgi:PAS domain S-box-containing protein
MGSQNFLNNPATRVAISYFTIAALWILFSDTLLHLFGLDQALIPGISILKGMGFVIVTATILYSHLRREFDVRYQLESRLQEQIKHIRQSQIALEQSEERFRRAVLTAPLPAMMYAEDGEVLLVNQTWRQITGYTDEDIPTIADWTARAYGERAAPARAVIERLFEADAPTYDGEFEIQTAHGSRVIWDFRSSPLGRLADERRVVLSMASDITQRKEVEHRMRMLNTELERRVQERTAHLAAVNQELSAFSYSVSHDLRTPLRAVDGFSQALLEDYYDQLDAMGRDFLNRIRSESQRMGQLIDDLISLSRVTQAEMGCERADLSRIVRDIAADLQEHEPERQVEFIIQDNVIACVDESLMRVALQNLIGNAWKFTAGVSRARIEFGCTAQNGLVEYYVRDNGAGFDMAYAHKLFGAFQRLHAMDEFEGTGIGLATVKRIVHRHGGTVRAEGVVNQGATFYFSLDGSICP